jgi:epoxyqueuosine reductase
VTLAFKNLLIARAKIEGFSKLGICAPDATPLTAVRLAAFLAHERHGQMAWMAERVEWRGSAQALWPQAQSVIMLAESYTPQVNPLDILDQPALAAISAYAQGRDYHDLVKRRLKRLGGWIVSETGAEIKVFVDTAPVMEKPLAEAAGVGWQGKHTNLLARDLGNWFFLGAIFTTLDLPKDQAEESHCGSCTACLDICPTQAFPAPYQLDARRCISYLTIEHRGSIDLELREKMGNRIYGCDDCLAVCPWNKYAQAAQDMGYDARIGAPSLQELAGLNDADFRTRFSGSPIKRIGRNRFIRNVIYAIGNSGDKTLQLILPPHFNDPDPVISDAAHWAFERLEKA